MFPPSHPLCTSYSLGKLHCGCACSSCPYCFYIPIPILNMEEQHKAVSPHSMVLSIVYVWPGEFSADAVYLAAWIWRSKAIMVLQLCNSDVLTVMSVLGVVGSCLLFVVNIDIVVSWFRAVGSWFRSLFHGWNRCVNIMALESDHNKQISLPTGNDCRTGRPQ
jgi:hypothetical protein